MTDKLMHDAFFLGVYPGLSRPMLDHMVASLKAVLEPAATGRTSRIPMVQIQGAA